VPTPDLAVLAFDRRQRGMFHAKSFEEYAATRVIPARINLVRTDDRRLWYRGPSAFEVLRLMTRS
jgi:hypothetical protein